MKKMLSKEIEEILNIEVKENENEKEIEKNFSVLNKNFDMLYNFSTLYLNHSNQFQEYSCSEKELSATEAHVLLDIVDNPKITVTELALKWRKTVSAISQIIKKLISKGYVYREISPENAKFYHLYSTEEGKKFTLCHKHYDNINTVKALKKIKNSCTKEEIISFYKVINEFIKIFSENN